MSKIKLGLYVADATEEIELDGYKATNSKWKRTVLFYNGEPVFKTAKESNKLGLYADGETLKLNGTDVASATSSNSSINVEGDKVSFGDAILSSDKCINITLHNYNLLRSGHLVFGYSRYNPKAVYRIVPRLDGATEVYHNIDDSLEDRIYNSFSGELPENTITDATYLDPIRTPSLAIRAFDAIIQKGQGVSFKYFVDTNDYESIYNGSIGDPTPHTFTLIVEDSFGNVIYKNTTYAGEFICNTASFKNGKNSNILYEGITWFSVHCIDEQGRGSIDRQFKVLIKDNTLPNIYEMSSEDLSTYHISYNASLDDYVAGHNNKLGFLRLFAWCKDHGYDGIKIYNSVGNTDINDESAPRYTIDNHHVLSLYSNNTWITNVEQLSIPTRYYIVEYKDGKIYGINKEIHEYTKSDFALFEMIPGQTLTIDGRSWDIPNNVSLFDWIRWDLGYLYRDQNNKIVVFWEHDLADNEVPLSDINSSDRVLRIKSLNGLLLHSRDKNTNKVYIDDISGLFFEGDGFYYLQETPGVHPTLDGGNKYDYKIDGNVVRPIRTEPMQLPDNFIIDCNYTKWEYTDSTDLHLKHKMFHFGNAVNSHLKNGKLVGPFTPEAAKTAFLKCCRVTTGAWEGYSLVSFDAAEFCTIDNVDVSQSGGYETVFGDLLNSDIVSELHWGIKQVSGKSSDGVYHEEDVMKLTTPGYIRNGVLTSSNFVIKDNGKSLLPDSPPPVSLTIDYNYWDGATDVCLVTSDDYINLDLHFNFLYKGLTINWELDASKIKGYFITSDCYAPGRSWHGAKRTEYFISFYKSDNTFIKTIKMMQHRPFYVPYEATKMKLTGYGLCNGTNLVLDPTYRVERALKDIRLNIDAHTQGCKFTNYCVHDTRTIAFCGTAYNVQVENCNFYNIASGPGRLSVTKMFMDVEEICNRGNVLAFRNCHVLANMFTPPGYLHSLTIIGTTERGSEYVIEDCIGLGISGSLTDCLIKDSTMGLLNIAANKNASNRCYNIIKRAKVIYECSFNANTTAKLLVGAKAPYKLRNTTDEYPPTVVCLEDCAIYPSGGNMTLTGRAYLRKNVVTDNYIEA